MILVGMVGSIGERGAKGHGPEKGPRIRAPIGSGARCGVRLKIFFLNRLTNSPRHVEGSPSSSFVSILYISPHHHVRPVAPLLSPLLPCLFPFTPLLYLPSTPHPSLQ